MNRYRFNISGYVEVLAASENDALEAIKTNAYGNSRTFTAHDVKDTAFLFAVPIVNKPELIEN